MAAKKKEASKPDDQPVEGAKPDTSERAAQLQMGQNRYPKNGDSN